MATWSPGTPLRWSLAIDEDVGEDEGVGGLGDVDADGGGVAAFAEEGELGGGGVADVEGDAAVGLGAEGVGAGGAEEVGGGVAEGGEVEGLVVGHRALRVGGWWTAGEVDGGGELAGASISGVNLGALCAVRVFSKKLLRCRGALFRWDLGAAGEGWFTGRGCVADPSPHSGGDAGGCISPWRG